MSFERHITPHLTQWKLSKNRKPLILRGARQVGKTTLVRQFSETYKNTIFLNLELPKDIRYFNDFDDVSTIIEALLISNSLAPEQKKNTLLFIDEIQESPKAIALLRYFFEMEPELHVIAAGSLLEHVMRKVNSFPVGRVQMLHLYPMNFLEYLKASGQTSPLEQISTVPVKPVAHKILLQLFHRYAIIGGMPEVIKRYIETNSVADLSMIYESIWDTYKNDVEKYASNASEARVIKHIISTAHLYVDERIKFQNFGNSNYRSREVGEAMRSLDDARIIQLIYPTTDKEVPVKPDLKKSPRLQFLDTGLINNELNIQAEMLAMEDLSSSYRGSIIPHLITQERMSVNTTKAVKPNFWVREKKQSSAEVDLVVPFQNYLIPVEIKSGKEGTLKSLHQFIEAADHPYAVRMYAGEFRIDQHTTRRGKEYFLMNLPYYLGTKLTEYIEYFLETTK
ncbi:MAG: ATP-binding protein [Crocinitomicaceae bacterium]